MVKIGLVGFGYWGPNVARNIYRNKNFDFKYLCDKKPERLELAKNTYAESVTYVEDYKKLLEDPELEAVALAVETSAHFQLAKHVYVEKPFTDSVEQAVILRDLAEEKKLKIHVDHIMVYHPVIKKIKDIIDSGDLGDLLYFDCSRINLGQLKNDVSSMWDLSVHDLSIIDYLSDGCEPVAVSAMGEKIYTKKESITFLNIKFEKFLANLRSSWLSPIKERRIIIAGTKKMIVYDDVDALNKLIVYDKGFDVKIIDNMEYEDFVVKTRIGDGIIPSLNQGDALFNSLDHFRDCIEENHDSITGPNSAIRMIKILEEADRQLI